MPPRTLGTRRTIPSPSPPRRMQGCELSLHPAEPSPVLSAPQGFTAIHFAAQQNKLSCLQVLVEEYKFPVNLPTNNGLMPLHLIIQKNNRSDIIPCIDYLLKKGADINS